MEVEGKESVMNDSRFLAQATGWVEVSLTEMRVRDKEDWEVGVGFGGKIKNQEFSFRHVKFGM